MMATTVGQQQVVAARAAFAEGDAQSLRLLPLPLQRSWQRSRAAGLQPGQEPCYPPLLGDGRHLSHPDDRRLAGCVRPELEQLWAAFGGRGWTMFCANRDGMVIAQQAHGLEDAPLLRPIQVGRRLGESVIGTTAPAVSLADDLPALVRGNEHYLQRFAPVFCLSEPLHDPDGRVCGAIDITGLGERDPSLLQGYFRQAALASENRLFSALADVHLLAVQHDPRWLLSPLQGLLAVQEDGQLRAANRVARRLLGLPRRGPLPLLDLGVLFAGASAAQRRRLLQPGAPHRVRLGEGSAVYLQHLQGPRCAARRGTPRRASNTTGTPLLRQQQREAARRAAQAADGNLSLAARQLGISRTTLYKLLRD
ncbi:Fis family transcriptional regulator [Mesorhizobium sp. M00.F.Ca.ET.151.01.1.1]|uniref:Fis family transcriptional regulator n=1 Tax=Stenotrophomonas maltophilia TaxID=40324 RepID=A0AB34TIF0_STEMA|nr:MULTISPECIES: helix-turn-helix domain-containing protein [Stenotrophomonas]TGR53438.1 Fis family transcriptional regulator [bacterium M00.F.Ca.ET.199.01.1.1]TGT07861.1 Fis family transcriptional regulator [bacterium M00.F.Ca.ET.177.01.1.1]TGT65109.1 Fis family transcriptional regulator [Mesorhizobium sp. M00.F.Ca.ET.170.01.1.1]TGU15253.1 Fis family transcriptional regulator [bacterium M00.F.Ca.ET.163.01.1.1]TGU97966.1 Fis family transcriptional regulator [Mesorhizobium sp. M00.F.Ca.ET.151.0